MLLYSKFFYAFYGFCFISYLKPLNVSFIVLKTIGKILVINFLTILIN